MASYRQCVRCGIHVDEPRLRCSKCRERVNEEFRGEANREFEYYFRHHLKRQRATNKKIEKDLFGKEGEFGSGKTLNRWLSGGSDFNS